ncbi:MAG: glycosyltransferase family 2 protein [Nocardioides sp.]
MAVLPAHDEEASIAASLASLHRQTCPPHEILVLADNCTDRTAEVARAHGARVIETVDNDHKKAGALNQGLSDLLDDAADDDLVLVMDADSVLHRGFVEGAVHRLDRDPGLGGVGGTFDGSPGGGLLGTFQRNEFARYARDVRRLRGKALVLTGTASVFRAGVLRHVRRARVQGELPDRAGLGQVYDVHVLTEDNELSLALMHLGYRILAPKECTLETEVMTTWGDLARQRGRWKRGALENLADYGFTSITAPYWGRQLLAVLGVLATVVYLASLTWGVLVGFRLHPFWIAASGVFILERVITVRARGWRQMMLASPLVVEMVYDVFLQLVQARAFAQALSGAERRW